MRFYIQASSPRIETVFDANDECLSEAIESIFPLNTENAILVWDYVCIPLSYKYDISYMIEDIIKLLNNLQQNKKGHLNINWLPDTFRCNWEINWDHGHLTIKSHWECTMGHLEEVLNHKGQISLSIEGFLCEWKKIFSVIIKALTKCGYKAGQLNGMQELLEQYEKINGSGILYR